MYYDAKGIVKAKEMYRYNKLQKQNLSDEAKEEKEEHQKNLDLKRGDYIPEGTIDE